MAWKYYILFKHFEVAKYIFKSYPYNLGTIFNWKTG